MQTQQAVSDYVLEPLYNKTLVFERESIMMEGRSRAASALGLSSPEDLDYSPDDREYFLKGLGCFCYY